MRNITKESEQRHGVADDPLGNAPSRGKRRMGKKRRETLGNPKRSSARKIELLFRFTLDNYPTTIRGDLEWLQVKSYGNLCGQ